MNRHFQSAKAPKEYQLQVNKWRSALYFFMVKMRLCAFFFSILLFALQILHMHSFVGYGSG